MQQPAKASECLPPIFTFRLTVCSWILRLSAAFALNNVPLELSRNVLKRMSGNNSYWTLQVLSRDNHVEKAEHSKSFDVAFTGYECKQTHANLFIRIIT